MQNKNPVFPPAPSAAETAFRQEIALLRQALAGHRDRSRQLWDACGERSVSSQESIIERRAALGRFTAQYLKGQGDAAYC